MPKASGARRVRSRQRWRATVLGTVALLGGCTVAGCTVDGTAVVAAYPIRPIDQLRAQPVVATVANVLALAPNGQAMAVSDPVHGVCIRVPADPRQVCADIELSGKHSISAAFSPDGERLAVGRDVSARAPGEVWLVDVHSGKTLEVPPVPANPPASAGNPAGSAGTPPAPRSTYTAFVWNSANAHLLLISSSFDSTGLRTLLVDVNPAVLIPHVVVQATSQYEFQSGYLAHGGPTVIFTVYRGDQIPPDLVIVDLYSGARREVGPLGAGGTQLVPLAVSPDGEKAVVGSATLDGQGPPRLLDLASSTLTEIPGLTGDFAMAAFSPDGSRIAVVSSVGTDAVTVAVAPTSGGRARTLLRSPARIADGSRLTWSALDVISIQTATPAGVGGLTGWTLSG